MLKAVVAVIPLAIRFENATATIPRVRMWFGSISEVTVPAEQRHIRQVHKRGTCKFHVENTEINKKRGIIEQLSYM